MPVADTPPADSMTLAEAATKGGLTTKERHGVEHYRLIGKKGGKANVAKRGPEYFREIGRKGGLARVAKSRALEASRKERDAQ